FCRFDLSLFDLCLSCQLLDSVRNLVGKFSYVRLFLVRWVIDDHDRRLYAAFGVLYLPTIANLLLDPRGYLIRCLQIASINEEKDSLLSCKGHPGQKDSFVGQGQLLKSGPSPSPSNFTHLRRWRRVVRQDFDRNETNETFEVMILIDDGQE